jgi:hypothetical protein
MRYRCLKNAEEILQILSYYDQHADVEQVLDFDAAVCTYHAARLVLFGTFSGTGDSSSSMETAISNAERSLDILSRRFSFSAAVEPMVRLSCCANASDVITLARILTSNQRDDLSRLIESYKGLARSPGEAVHDIEQGPRAAPGVSKAAVARQRLSVHSLLLRSDFVDDSREAATEPSREVSAEQSSAWENAAAVSRHLPLMQENWTQPATFSLDSPFPNPGLIGMYDGASFDFSMWPLFPASFDALGTGSHDTGHNEQYLYY